jgi:4a-hydroxytetrahydrobiopterin dehydratase
MIYILALLLVASPKALADYRFVSGEDAGGVLASANALFSGLLSSASLTSVPVVSVCLPPENYTAAVAAYAIPSWSIVLGVAGGTDSLQKNYTFPTFRGAYAFMSGVAVLADVNDHHQLWSNVYNFVSAVLSTDDRKCLSTFDFELARGMDALAAAYSCGAANCSSNGLCAADSVPAFACRCASTFSGAKCDIAGPAAAGSAASYACARSAASVAAPLAVLAVSALAYTLYIRQRKGWADAAETPLMKP